MKTNKRLLIVIALLLIIGIIGVGGKVYMDKKEGKKEAEKIEAERMSVVALKKTFADIKSVEFKASEYTVMTGYYNMVVKMTNIDGEFVEFDYGFSPNRPNEIASWLVIDEEKVQKKGRTKSKVQVIYTDGSEGEI